MKGEVKGEGGKFQDGSEFTIASSKTPALQAKFRLLCRFLANEKAAAM